MIMSSAASDFGDFNHEMLNLTYTTYRMYIEYTRNNRLQITFSQRFAYTAGPKIVDRKLNW